MHHRGDGGTSEGLEPEHDGQDRPVGSDSEREGPPATEQDRASAGDRDDNAREGYEDEGGSRDADGTRGESSGSRPGYR